MRSLRARIDRLEGFRGGARGYTRAEDMPDSMLIKIILDGSPELSIEA
jgi:hypothetical protein